MDDTKKDYDTVYIVSTPFAGTEQAIADNFIIDGVETNALVDNSCILTESGSILVENVSDVTDKDYISIPHSVEPENMHADFQTDSDFNVIPEQITPKELEAEKSEDELSNPLFLRGKRKKSSKNIFGYQTADPVIPNGVEVDEFTCPYCLKSFPKVSNKKTHMRAVHNVSFRGTGFIKCVECNIEFLLVNKLRQHLKETHEMEMTQEVHRFPNMESFRVWKGNLEKHNNEFFIQQYGPKRKKQGVKWGYVCHRSGKHRNSAKDKVRRRMFRNQGSFKMEIYCTAAISIEERKNEVIVKHWPQHYGHLRDMCTEHPRTLSENVPFQDLLEDMRQNVASERITQMKLKKRNIKALKSAFESEEYNPGLTDSESVDRWVRLCLQMGDSPVLCYKQDESENEEFILVVMTEFQKQLLVSSEKKVVNVDCAHRKKGGRFYLTCISVMDECDVAFPVAFCISNKIDQDIVKSFLISVRDSTGPLSCTYFMSDGDSFYFDAWKEIMNDNSKWLWSMWYFDYNIHIQLRFFRNDVLKKAEAYKTLRTLIECPSQSVFEISFKKFLDALMADPGSKKLGDFLSKKYGTNMEHWAYCYRTDLKPTANFQLDCLHRTLRYCCREGRKKRLDKFIFVLIKFLKMKMLDRLANILDEEKIQMAVEAINVCHEEGVVIPTDSISSLSDKIWLVKTSDLYESVYVVRDYDSCPERCKLRCDECDICVHMYSCSCIPSMINANLCQHIHAVVWKFLTPHFTPVPSPMHNIDENEIFRTSKRTPNLLGSVLRKTHEIYKKVRKHKWNLNQESLAVIMNKLEELGDCIEVCAVNKNPPEAESTDFHQAKVKKENNFKEEFESIFNVTGSCSQKTSKLNIVYPQRVQRYSTVYPEIPQVPTQSQQTLQSNSTQTFYLPNQPVVFPQNKLPLQPYILIIPHASLNKE